MSDKTGEKKFSPISIAEVTTLGLRIIQCYINKEEGKVAGVGRETEAGDKGVPVAQLVSMHGTSTEGGDEVAEGNRGKVWKACVPH